MYWLLALILLIQGGNAAPASGSKVVAGSSIGVPVTTLANAIFPTAMLSTSMLPGPTQSSSTGTGATGTGATGTGPGPTSSVADAPVSLAPSASAAGSPTTGSPAAGNPATGSPAAANPAAGNQGQQGGLFSNPMFLFIPMILLFYFIVLRPERRRAADANKLRDGLQKYDRIVTTGGIFGMVINASDPNEVTISIDESNNTRVRILRSSIATVITKPENDSDKAKKKA
jgi:preprotein translocase subunit YajC